jgi:Protein of unknown function (DUF3304)
MLCNIHFRHPTRPARRALWALWLSACLCMGLTLQACRAQDKTESIPVTITGLDHLAEHLSIQDFWVNGTGGHQAGKGGSQVCCVSLPDKWQPSLQVKVRWGVTNWKRRVYTMYEKTVSLESCKDAYPGRLWVHFLADGKVRAISCDVGPSFYAQNAEYPGPQPLSQLPQKRPWTDYKRKAEEPEFAEVANAMED